MNRLCAAGREAAAARARGSDPQDVLTTEGGADEAVASLKGVLTKWSRPAGYARQDENLFGP